jgi:hypothetical protein
VFTPPGPSSIWDDRRGGTCSGKCLGPCAASGSADPPFTAAKISTTPKEARSIFKVALILPEYKSVWHVVATKWIGALSRHSPQPTLYSLRKALLEIPNREIIHS